MKCSGLHCDGCGGHGGAAITGVVVLCILAAVIYRVRHGVETGLEIGVYVLAGLLVLGAAGLVAFLRLRRSARFRAGTALVMRNEAYLGARQADAIPAPAARPRLEAADQHVHLHLDGMNPAEVAAIIARMSQNGSNQ